jgi:transcription elongation factor Elf1
MLHFKCPLCGYAGTADIADAGAITFCAGCSRKLVVPTPIKPPANITVATKPRVNVAGSSKLKPIFQNWKYKGPILAGATALLGGGVFLGIFMALLIPCIGIPYLCLVIGAMVFSIPAFAATKYWTGCCPYCNGTVVVGGLIGMEADRGGIQCQMCKHSSRIVGGRLWRMDDPNAPAALSEDAFNV